jgi:hypothetical protein
MSVTADFAATVGHSRPGCPDADLTPPVQSCRSCGCFVWPTVVRRDQGNYWGSLIPVFSAQAHGLAC